MEQHQTCTVLAPTSAKSLVLGNVELLELILYQNQAVVDRSGSYSDGRRTLRQQLLRTALTSKPFFEASMIILWQSMDSFLAILKLIPTFHVVGQTGTWTTTGIILEEHLQRLDFYARHIRSLDLKIFRHQVSSHVFSTIIRYRGHTGLFPGLKTLTIQSIDRLSMANRFIMLLVSSSNLTAVSVCDISQTTEVEVASFLHGLSESKTPFLQELTLSGYLSPLSLDLVKKFPRLITLRVVFHGQGPNTDILRICSEVVGLKTLSIKFELPRSPFIPPPPTMVYNLNSLITLALEGLPGHVLRIVECMQVPNVDAITLTYLSGPHGRNDEQNSPDSVNACLRRCTLMTPSLQVLEIHAQHYTTITWKTFLPLRICSHLRRLEVCVQPFTDTDIVDLFGSGEWTSLETLRFTLIGLVYSSSWPSLLGLNTFATYCPNLKTLEICIRIDHSTDLTSLLHYASIPRSCHNLETLEIYGQRGNPFWVGYKDNEIMTAGVVVSRYIDHLFPSLKLLSFGESSCTRKWCEGVADMVKSYQEMRGRHAS